jgi:endonuclease/exonuclease/phosphatase family metal-dependent hydrolase
MQKNRGSILNRILRWANVLLILFTLLVYLVPEVNPKVFWPMALLGPTYPWLLLLHAGFIVFWALMRKAYLLMSLTCVLLGWSHLTAIYAFRLPQSGEKADLRVMSYNVYTLRRVIHRDEVTLEGPRAGEFIGFMNSLEPSDVLCTQECPERITRAIATGLRYPHTYTVRGTAILSRYPLLAQGAIRFENSTNSVAWADIQVEGQRLRIYSVHLQSNQISGDAARLKETGDLQERETWVGIKGILRKYKRATQRRAEQAEQLAAHIAKSPYPVVVCGDFNDTPVSFAYRRIVGSADLADSFREKGSGPGFTYGGVLPALRIDYILTDPRLSLLNHDRYRESFSDHFPVLCEIDIP